MGGRGLKVLQLLQITVRYLCSTHTSACCDKTFSSQHVHLFKIFSFQHILLFNSCPPVLDSTNPSFLPISFALYCKWPGATGKLLVGLNIGQAALRPQQLACGLVGLNNKLVGLKNRRGRQACRPQRGKKLLELKNKSAAHEQHRSSKHSHTHTYKHTWKGGEGVVGECPLLL
jgi:hypothetical protein